MRGYTSSSYFVFFLCFCTLVDAMHTRVSAEQTWCQSIAYVASLNHSIVIVVCLLLLASSPSAQRGLAARPLKKPALGHSRLVSLTFAAVCAVIRNWGADIFTVYTDMNGFGCAGCLCACKHHVWNILRLITGLLKFITALLFFFSGSLQTPLR